MVARDRLAGSAAEAVAFTAALSRAILPAAAAELAELCLEKAAVEPSSSSSPSPSIAPAAALHGSSSSSSTAQRLAAAIASRCGCAPLQPWDVAFYARRLSTARQRGGDSLAEAAPFLPVAAALQGLCSLMLQVFGVALEAVPLAEGEGESVPVREPEEDRVAEPERPLLKLCTELKVMVTV
jgi:hypothetical protein